MNDKSGRGQKKAGLDSRRVLPIILLSVLSFELALLWGSMFSQLDASSVDLFMRWRRVLQGDEFRPRSDITVVAIDNASLEEFGLFGRGEWLTRRPFIDHLRMMFSHYQPTVLAYDLIFQESLGREARNYDASTEDQARLDRIERAIAALRKGDDMPGQGVLTDMTELSVQQGNRAFQGALAAVQEEGRFDIVLGFNFRGGQVDPQEAEIADWSENDIAGEDAGGNENEGARIPYLTDIAIPDGWLHFISETERAEYGYSLNANFPSLKLIDYARLGALNVQREEDGIIRRVPMVLGFKFRNPVTGIERLSFVPSFSLMSAMLHMGITFPLQQSDEPPIEVFWGREIVLRPAGRDEIRVPIDAAGRMYVDFTARFNDFQVVGFADAARRQAGRDLSSVMDGKLVFVGLAATATSDIGACPLSYLTPLVHVQVMSACNILDGSFLVPLSRGGRAIVYAVLIVLFTLICIAQATPRLSAVAFLAGFAYWLAAYVCIHYSTVILPIVAPLLYIVFCSFTVMAYRYFTEGVGKRRIRMLFSTMVSPEVLSYLEENPDSVSLEGRNAEVSVLFSDIADFATLSETLPPDRISRMLNSYLTPVTECIMSRGGYVDKFVGDLVMAVWGVPLPDEEHAIKSCECAIAQQTIIGELSSKWQSDYGVGLKVRMGVNSGIAAAGNMGAERKFQYTVMGDVVNLASRLEPANKDYGTSIIIGQSTRDLVASKMVTRQLDRIIVKGRSEVEPVYELIGLQGAVDASTLEMVDMFEEALARYYRRDWSGTIVILDRILGKRRDQPSLHLAKAAMECRENPPAPGWQGERVRETKH